MAGPKAQYLGGHQPHTATKRRGAPMERGLRILGKEEGNQASLVPKPVPERPRPGAYNSRKARLIGSPGGKPWQLPDSGQA